MCLARLWVRLSELSSHLTVSRGGQANLENFNGEKGGTNPSPKLTEYPPRFKDEKRYDIDYGYLKNSTVITPWPTLMSIQV